MEQYTETTNTSYGSNIGNSFKGIVTGFLMIGLAIGLLWWNEGRTVEQADALGEMYRDITTLADTKYNAKYEDKPVLIQGNVKPTTRLKDPQFKVYSDGLILRKNVKMYQWQEKTTTKTEEKIGGGTETITTYSYVKEWSSTAINSSSFHHYQNHQNPLMTYKSEIFSTDAKMGDYNIDKNIIGHITTDKEFKGLSKMKRRVGVAKNYKSFLYLGYNPKQPRIGDMKITYSYTPSGIYSFAGKLEQKSITKYNTKNGKSFLFVREGKVDADIIFKSEQSANVTLAWILRGVGFIVMFIGFTMIMGPLSALANVLPFLGSIVSGVTGVVAGALTFILGSIVISIAWFSVRPMLSLSIIGIGVVIGLVLGKFGKRRG